MHAHDELGVPMSRLRSESSDHKIYCLWRVTYYSEASSLKLPGGLQATYN